MACWPYPISIQIKSNCGIKQIFMAGGSSDHVSKNVFAITCTCIPTRHPVGSILEYAQHTVSVGFLWIFWVVFPEEMPDQPQKPGKCKKIKTEKLRTAKKLKSHQMPPETRVETHFMPYASPPSAEAGICLLWLLAAVWFSTGSRGSQRPHPKETV